MKSTVASVGGNDTNTGNNDSATQTHTIVNLHDLSVSKTASVAQVAVGGTIQYNAFVENLGTFSQAGGNAAASSNAFGFFVTDLLGAGVTQLVSRRPPPISPVRPPYSLPLVGSLH
ncbi:MAG: hypothetical protein U0Y68_00490 [Blastocatellia bacterium]